MNVVIFGATGMVGTGVLLECLDDPRIERVLLVSRQKTDIRHPKIQEQLHKDFLDFSSLQPLFVDLDACYFCLGVSSLGMSETDYYRLTYDLTLAAATALAAATGGRLTFCYVSGRGTDSTERGRIGWARIKGKTENALLRQPFKAAYMFRPAYIQPLRGARSKTQWVQLAYNGIGALYPVLARLFPASVTTTVNIGRAMIRVSIEGSPHPILSSTDINRLAHA